MSRREKPVGIRELSRSPSGHPDRRSPALAGVGRCPGAAAQLAAVRGTLRHGAALQLRAGGAATNRTGLPDGLKAGVEALSGVSLDGVKVHYNSPEPAQLNALAYARGSDIHLGPGQEKHLPHEAWHVVQQAQGRVRPTMQMRDGIPVNDDDGLEREADAMGARALAQAGHSDGGPLDDEPRRGATASVAQGRSMLTAVAAFGDPVVQPKWVDEEGKAFDLGQLQKWGTPLRALIELGKAAWNVKAHLLETALEAEGRKDMLAKAERLLADSIDTGDQFTIDLLLTDTLQYLGIKAEGEEEQDTDNEEMAVAVEDPVREEGLGAETGMTDQYHDDDEGTDVAPEPLVPGDLEIPAIIPEQQKIIARALIDRHPDLYKTFSDLAKSIKQEPSPEVFLQWFNSGPLTRSKFAAQFKTVQFARGPGESYQEAYVSPKNGWYRKVTYVRNAQGAIDFGSPKADWSQWTDPLVAGSRCQLNQGSTKHAYGITLDGTKLPIPKASRSQHFSMANRIANNKCGSQSPPQLTWHHLPAHYEMVLVDRTVHLKHGHNGGKFLWS